MIRAQLVFDGRELTVPKSMGTPKENQLQGTVREQLGELACRICYDSLGKGRNSEDLHKHIMEVKNLSVYEHIVFTVKIPGFDNYQSLMNRKGVYCFWDQITVNLRAVIEWDRWSNNFNNDPKLRETLKHWASILCPQIIPWGGKVLESEGVNAFDGVYPKSELVPGSTRDQRWVSMYMYGSRGWSHEQVRHRFAMSQRSTRYVDEDGSPYVEHPLLREYMASDLIDDTKKQYMYCIIEESKMADRATYRYMVQELEKFGTGDKLSNRKQARGCARGYLGNALATEMIFSAPLSGWDWMILQRRSPLADGEINEVYGEVVRELDSAGLIPMNS